MRVVGGGGCIFESFGGVLIFWGGKRGVTRWVVA